MTDAVPPRQGPRVFDIDDVELERPSQDDPRISPRAARPAEDDASDDALPPDPTIAPGSRNRRFGWLGVLVSAIGGLLLLSFGLWATSLVDDVLARKDWLGWTGLALLSIGGVAALILILRETLALLRLGQLNALRKRAAAAVADTDDAKAAAVSTEVLALYAARPDLDWARARMTPADAGTGGLAALRSTEASVVEAIDREAARAVERAAERVAAVTVLSPFLIFDVVAIIVINIRLLRRIAGLYGGRPGLVGALRLGRLAIVQIFADVGFELAGDFLPATVARGAGFFGRKVGEGMVNGFMTARIGCNAMELCRPLPFDAVKRPNPMAIFGRISRRYAGAAGRAAYEAGRDAVGRAASGVVNAVTGGRAGGSDTGAKDKS